MSANDVDGQPARVDDRSGPLPGPATRNPERLWWLAPLLLLPLLVGVELRETDLTRRTPDIAPGLALTSDLPLHVNDRVERWLDRFRTTRKHEFDALMARRGIFAGMIRDKLRARGMPEDLLYLAMIESSLYPWAVSRVSAVGLWQFMSPTALQYGLRVDEYVDERRDPIRATDAALDYLGRLYTRFGSWYLAAAAYNAGPGRVERILRRHAGGRTGEEDLYWEILEHLPRETREYVPRLVALTILADHADRSRTGPIGAEPYAYDRIFVPGGTELSRIASALGIGASILRELNPHLMRGVTPPNEIYAVRVPVGRSAAVMASLAGADGTARADD